MLSWRGLILLLYWYYPFVSCWLVSCSLRWTMTSHQTYTAVDLPWMCWCRCHKVAIWSTHCCSRTWKKLKKNRDVLGLACHCTGIACVQNIQHLIGLYQYMVYSALAPEHTVTKFIQYHLDMDIVHVLHNPRVQALVAPYSQASTSVQVMPCPYLFTLVSVCWIGLCLLL